MSLSCLAALNGHAPAKLATSALCRQYAFLHKIALKTVTLNLIQGLSSTVTKLPPVQKCATLCNFIFSHKLICVELSLRLRYRTWLSLISEILRPLFISKLKNKAFLVFFARNSFIFLISSRLFYFVDSIHLQTFRATYITQKKVKVKCERANEQKAFQISFKRRLNSV